MNKKKKNNFTLYYEKVLRGLFFCVIIFRVSTNVSVLRTNGGNIWQINQLIL
jgi:hypothetical protein